MFRGAMAGMFVSGILLSVGFGQTPEEQAIEAESLASDALNACDMSWNQAEFLRDDSEAMKQHALILRYYAVENGASAAELQVGDDLIDDGDVEYDSGQADHR